MWLEDEDAIVVKVYYDDYFIRGDGDVGGAVYLFEVIILSIKFV